MGTGCLVDMATLSRTAVIRTRVPDEVLFHVSSAFVFAPNMVQFVLLPEDRLVAP